MTYLLESELLQSQDTWKRSQIRLTPTLHKAVIDYTAEEDLASLNTAMLVLINQGLSSLKKTKRKIIFLEWHPVDLELEDSDSFMSHNEKVRMACSEYMSDFFNRHQSYKLINFEFKDQTHRINRKDRNVLYGVRIWYSYPVSN